MSLDLLATCGLISFGHAGLLGVGCYVFAGVTVLMGGSPNLAFPAAIVAGADPTSFGYANPLNVYLQVQFKL